jgi:fructuronate reductase
LNEGLDDKGIIVAEGYDYEIIDVAYTPYDNLCLAVSLKADGKIDKTVVASIMEALKINEDDFPRLKEIFAAKSLQILSLTITEKGYSLVRGDGSLLPDVEADITNGPAAPQSYIGKLATLCHHRYLSGAAPLALVSMDNCSHNGTRLYEAVHRFAAEWMQKGLVCEGFLSYVEDPGRLSFPWSMIDKITPRPDDSVKKMLNDIGLNGIDGNITAKNTNIAPFVNAEESEYLVIEDAFPNGRPPFEKAGVIVTSREIVDKTEKMKVCTCLNPLHTALAIFGCLLSYEKISDEMQDELLVKLIRRVADEGLPVVVDPGIISPAEFIDTVINVRLPNPFMPDTPQRIATDTSQKITVRFGETIKAYLKNDALDIKNLRAIPLVIAGWCRYLLAIDDNGNSFELNPDPMLPELMSIFAGISLGQSIDCHKTLAPLLSNVALFGVDLYEVGMACQVEAYFKKMMAGKNAVRQTLKEVLND